MDKNEANVDIISTVDVIKANKKQVQKSQHEIQREIFALERQEKETLAEIKKMAAKGQVRCVGFRRRRGIMWRET